MDYDINMMSALESNHMYYRFYKWNQRGITYSYKQSPPPELLSLDTGQRYTGGGIVFHCPGDLVFTVCDWLHNAYFPKSLKEKMNYITKQIQSIAQKVGIPLTQHTHTTSPNYDFCHSYPNPYELFLGPHKVTAITIRKSRDRFLIQGIIHTQDQFHHFSDYPLYQAYFSEGLSQVDPATSQKFANRLKDDFI